MAALLASRLEKTVYDEFKIKPSEVILWSDSMIVLAWLRSELTSLQPFVGVQVAEIQATWESDTWRYVPTDLNPADDLSRGIPVTKINEHWVNILRSSKAVPKRGLLKATKHHPMYPKSKLPNPYIHTYIHTFTFISTR